MVKGISRQVILVHGPDTEMFEQAIFILKENTGEVTDEMLLKEAKRIINNSGKTRRPSGPVWAFAGAVFTGLIWILSIFL
ncbi:MAG: translation initiation factor 2 [Oscillospiraceae bacterium]|jgi:hypothetical protein|nr:translation initiation factor 2 [Oscillospiraceae bacterium]